MSNYEGRIDVRIEQKRKSTITRGEKKSGIWLRGC